MITQELVRELFDYDEKSGIITWKVNKGIMSIGEEAGRLNNGYLSTRIDGKRYYNHRIIFLWYHGYLPKSVDHKDNVGSHNWIDNLRECTQSQNEHNRKMNKNNTSGVKGVTWHKSLKQWQAQLQTNGKQIYLGCFKSLSDAEVVVRRFRAKQHKEFANHE